MAPGYAACDYCLSAVLEHGRPGGRISAQVAADLRAAPALLLALQVLRWAALRHLAISCLFLLFPPMARASPGWLPVPVVRVHYDCPSVFPACVLVRRCQARSCLLQNLAPTDAVLCLLHLILMINIMFIIHVVMIHVKK